MFFDIHTNISFPGSMVDAGPIISLTFLPSLLFVTRTRKLLHVSNLSKPSCIASTWRRPDLLPLSFLTCRWYKIQVAFYSHTWGLHSIVVSIFVNVLVELTNTNICQFNQYIYKYWDSSQCCLLGMDCQFFPLPNNSSVGEPVGVFCSSAHHADNHFNLSLKRQKDGKCLTKQDKEQPKTCYLYSSILSVS